LRRAPWPPSRLLHATNHYRVAPNISLRATRERPERDPKGPPEAARFRHHRSSRDRVPPMPISPIALSTGRSGGCPAVHSAPAVGHCRPATGKTRSASRSTSAGTPGKLQTALPVGRIGLITVFQRRPPDRPGLPPACAAMTACAPSLIWAFGLCGYQFLSWRPSADHIVDSAVG
jgi:hypothetical protein